MELSNKLSVTQDIVSMFWTPGSRLETWCMSKTVELAWQSENLDAALKQSLLGIEFVKKFLLIMCTQRRFVEVMV